MSIEQSTLQIPGSLVTHRRVIGAPVAMLIILAILIGTTTQVTWSALSQTTGGHAGARVEQIATTRAWFHAVNQYLKTGDAAAIARTTGDTFVERHPWPGMAGNRDGLLQTLDALHSQLPVLQLNPTILDVSGSIVTLNVEATIGEAPQLPQGDAQAKSLTWMERLRIVNGRVIERWGPDLPFAVTLQQTTLQTEQFTEFRAARVVQLTLDPGLAFITKESLIVVESGELRFEAKDGLFLVRNGVVSTGAPNLEDEAIATARDIVYAKRPASFDVVSASQIILADSGKKIGRKEIPYGTVPPQYMPPKNPESKLYDELLPLNGISLDGGVSIKPFFNWGEVNGMSISQLSWQTLSIPAGTLLPSVGAGKLAIVFVDEGEVVSDFIGKPTVGGEHFINFGGDEFTFSTSTRPSAVRMLVFTLVK